MITRVSSVIRPEGSDLVFDHPYDADSVRLAGFACWSGPRGGERTRPGAVHRGRDQHGSGRLSVTVGERPSPVIETIAYFCAAELLASAAGHSGADRATIGVTCQDERLLRLGDGRGEGG